MCFFFGGITKQRMSASYGHLQMVVQTIEINGLETKPYLVFEYFSTITYQFNLNYGRLVLQTTNLDGLDNHLQVSTACAHPWISIALRNRGSRVNPDIIHIEREYA